LPNAKSMRKKEPVPMNAMSIGANINQKQGGNTDENK